MSLVKNDMNSIGVTFSGSGTFQRGDTDPGEETNKEQFVTGAQSVAKLEKDEQLTGQDGAKEVKQATQDDDQKLSSSENPAVNVHDDTEEDKNKILERELEDVTSIQQADGLVSGGPSNVHLPAIMDSQDALRVQHNISNMPAYVPG